MKFVTLYKDPKKVSPKMDYPKFRASEIITSFLLEDCAQVALQYFWLEEGFDIFKAQIHCNSY